MKILIISANFYPILGPRAHRATELALELANQNHQVSSLSLCGQYDYKEFESSTGIRILNLGRSRMGLLHNDNTRDYPLHIKAINKFLGKSLDLPYSELYFLVKNFLEKHHENYDLVISLAHPHPIHWGVARYLDDNPGFTKKWIADCGDPYMLDPLNKHPAYFEKFERKFCEKADAITVPYEGAKKGYYPEYISKIKVIPQGFNFNNVEIEKYIPNSVPTFAYSGVFYKKHRDPSSFLEFLSNLDYEFKFIIYTKSTVLLEPYLQKLGSKLEIRSYIPRSELLKELSKMDFLINIENESEIQSPSKLIDYALTQRPILNVKSNFTETVAFEEFIKGNFSEQLIIKDIENYQIQNVVKKFLEI